MRNPPISLIMLRSLVRFQPAPLSFFRDLPVLTRDMTVRVGTELEVPRGPKAVEQDPRPFIWIDADIDLLEDLSVTPRVWADSISLPTLLIAPDTRTGLLAAQLDAVDEFVRRHGDSDADETFRT
jgi:hypothetical protein